MDIPVNLWEVLRKQISKDILNFIRVHPTMTAVEAAQAFRTKYLGYKASYTEDELIEDFKSPKKEEK